ncbi:glycogen/starch synthase [Robiginitalea sp. M366]|uniref:glycogen synthase n=1 Tax=Robiginitalea aestuariiviva TaxID=3036903 RepID=UPI00240E79CA|nr:glycogen/starch synthase [Robiginitalea aestuariiviva]MDG1572130.1 glycogen/starch synthase [Robiginitalea aestuariiviva]
MNRFLFVAAENDALEQCKAGGMGDVVRDVPRQLAQRGDQVHVVVPSYGRLHPKGDYRGTLEVRLRGQGYTLELYEMPPKKAIDGIVHYALHHPEIEAGDIAHIYHNDPEEPFYTDFIKFAIFCAGVAQAIVQGVFGQLQVVHLHDWHSSLLLLLREAHPAFEGLKPIRFVYSIHNLAIQGIRPLADNYASLENWFPELEYDYAAVADPRYPDCMNLMAVGIRLADAVHTVSPSYMEDIMKPSAPPEFIGGEGLEADLKRAHREARLFGILNGCNYGNIRTAEPGRLYANTVRAIFGWLQEESKKYKADFLAHTGEKVFALTENPPDFVCSSVARLTEQKFYFFKNNPEVLARMLKRLEAVNGIFMLLGTGAPEYEQLFRQMSFEHPNFIFTNGQSEDVIDSMYLETNLYLMPSLFEPCGISQMLAMRNGNPVLAHATGGLKDTIRHMETGFLFDGDTYPEKLRSLEAVFDQALELYFQEPDRWEAMREKAREMRFTWAQSVDRYYTELYRLSPAG